MRELPDTVATPLLPCATTVTLVAIAPEAVLVMLDRIPVVGVQFPDAQNTALAVTAPMTGVGGLPIVIVTVDGVDGMPSGPVAE